MTPKVLDQSETSGAQVVTVMPDDTRLSVVETATVIHTATSPAVTTVHTASLETFAFDPRS